MTTEIARFMVKLAAIWDAHVKALLSTRDIEAALVDSVAEPSVVHIPAMTGARGRAAVERFYASELLPHLPPDLTLSRLSRTVDRFHLVDETTVSFTHDRELPWLLPEVAPTGRVVKVLTIAVVGFERGKLSSSRVLWDYATMMAQLGFAGPLVTPSPGALPAGT